MTQQTLQQLIDARLTITRAHVDRVELLPQQLSLDTGAYLTRANKVVRASNVVHEDHAFRPMRAPERVGSDSLPWQGQTILDAHSVLYDQGVASVVVTDRAVYSLSGPGTAANAPILDWRVTAESGSAVSYQGSIYVSTDTNAMVKIDIDENTGEFSSSEVAGAPFGKVAAVVGAFMVLGDTRLASESDFVTNRLLWSDANDPTNWVRGGDAGSIAGNHFFQDIGAIVAIAEQDGDIVVFGEDSVHYADFNPSAGDFSFRKIAEIGAVGANAVAAYGHDLYFISKQGFFRLEQSKAIVPIGEGAVNNHVSADISVDPRQLKTAVVQVDTSNDSVLFSYPSQTEGDEETYVFNYNSGYFTTTNAVRPLASLQLGTQRVTLDERAGGDPTRTTLKEWAAENQPQLLADGKLTLDEVPYSFDSAFWSGRADRALTYLNANGLIERVQGDGAPLEAVIAWPVLQLGQGDRIQIQKIRVNMEQAAGDPSQAEVILYSAASTLEMDNLRREERGVRMYLDGNSEIRKSTSPLPNSFYTFFLIEIRMRAGFDFGLLKSVDVDYRREPELQ